MGKKLSQMSLEELWQLFPIILEEHRPVWREWYAQEEEFLRGVIPEAIRIEHIGSTAIEGIWAKPIIDILVEISEDRSLSGVKERVCTAGYICMSRSERRISCNKGYTEDGFAEKVFHLHIRYAGDHDEIYFRDYLRAHADIALEYERLKKELRTKYEHDRDEYTAQKTDFVARYTQEAKRIYAEQK